MKLSEQRALRCIVSWKFAHKRALTPPHKYILHYIAQVSSVLPNPQINKVGSRLAERNAVVGIQQDVVPKPQLPRMAIWRRQPQTSTVSPLPTSGSGVLPGATPEEVKEQTSSRPRTISEVLSCSFSGFQPQCAIRCRAYFLWPEQTQPSLRMKTLRARRYSRYRRCC